VDDAGDDAIERVMLALRTDRGAPAQWLDPARTGDFEREGLVEVRDGRVRATDRGFLVLNDLVLHLSGRGAAAATGSGTTC
jgi:hypothetical protein